MNLAPLMDADRIQDLERFGEEAWHLVRVIEQSFNVEFTADDLIQANTVEKLAGCISKKVAGQPERCLSAVVFYRLRQVSVDLLSIARTDIRPETRLEELFPWPQRIGRWKTLGTRSELVLPKLTYPSWLVGVVLLISMVTPWFFMKTLGEISAVLAIVVGWIPVFWGLLWLTRPIARAFPKSCATFGDLTRAAVARNHARLANELGACSGRELLVTLRQLIAIETGTNAEEVWEGTAFPDGLGIE